LVDGGWLMVDGVKRNTDMILAAKNRKRRRGLLCRSVGEELGGDLEQGDSGVPPHETVSIEKTDTQVICGAESGEAEIAEGDCCKAPGRGALSFERGHEPRDNQIRWGSDAGKDRDRVHAKLFVGVSNASQNCGQCRESIGSKRLEGEHGDGSGWGVCVADYVEQLGHCWEPDPAKCDRSARSDVWVAFVSRELHEVRNGGRGHGSQRLESSHRLLSAPSYWVVGGPVFNTGRNESLRGGVHSGTDPNARSANVRLKEDGLQKRRQSVGSDVADRFRCFEALGRPGIFGRNDGEGGKPLEEGSALVTGFIVAGGEGHDTCDNRQAGEGDQEFAVLAHGGSVACRGPIGNVELTTDEHGFTRMRTTTREHRGHKGSGCLGAQHRLDEHNTRQGHRTFAIGQLLWILSITVDEVMVLELVQSPAPLGVIYGKGLFAFQGGELLPPFRHDRVVADPNLMEHGIEFLAQTQGEDFIPTVKQAVGIGLILRVGVVRAEELREGVVGAWFVQGHAQNVA